MLISSFDKTSHTCKIVRIVLVDIYFNDKMETLVIHLFWILLSVVNLNDLLYLCT